MSDAPSLPRDAELLRSLPTEQANPATTEFDRMSALEIAREMNLADATVAAAVAAELPAVATAIEAIAERLRRGGRLIYTGAGSSGRLAALDAIECPPTFGMPADRIVACVAGGAFALDQAAEDAEDNADAGAADLARLGVGPADAVVGITASGRTPYTLGAIAYARGQGALTVGLACNTDTPLGAQVDLLIAPVVGPEVLAGSTRLKAGTAQKMVLNMLSTGVMVLLGKTYGNLMVDVRATNAKLRERALAIVSQTTGLERERTVALLAACDGEVKTAILATQAGLSPQRARARLAAHGGHLWAALREATTDKPDAGSAGGDEA